MSFDWDKKTESPIRKKMEDIRLELIKISFDITDLIAIETALLPRVGHNKCETHYCEGAIKGLNSAEVQLRQVLGSLYHALLPYGDHRFGIPARMTEEEWAEALDFPPFNKDVHLNMLELGYENTRKWNPTPLDYYTIDKCSVQFDQDGKWWQYTNGKYSRIRKNSVVSPAPAKAKLIPKKRKLIPGHYFSPKR